MTNYNIPSIEDLRANLAKTQPNSNGKSTGYQKDNAVYPFWVAPDNTTTILRLLPDSDPTNPNFWRERHMINLPFKGVAGTDHFNEVIVQVPCITMYGKKCPIIEAIRPWWKDESKKPVARIYNKKQTFIFQGFVREGHFTEENVPENPIRRFMITKSVYEIIFRGVFDPDMEVSPIHFDRGTDFKVHKVPGAYGANYDASGFARKESALTEAERAAIEKYGLHRLADYQPNEPSTEQVGIIYNMFEDSISGKPYDPSKFAAYYLPSAFQKAGNISETVMEQIKSPSVGSGQTAFVAPQAPVQAPVQSPVQESVQQPVQQPAVNSGADVQADILAQLNAQIRQS